MRIEAARAARRDTTQGATCWSVGRQALHLGDCLEQLRRLEAGCVDVCVTSPPYNIGIAYSTHDDRMPKAAYLDWMGCVAAEIARVLRDDGALFLNVGSTNVDPWIAMEVASQFRRALTLQNQIVWVKSVSVGDDTFGHFKPINSARFLNNNHEAIFHFTKSGRAAIDRLAVGVPFKHKSNIARWGHARDRRCAGNVWFLPYKTVQSRTEKFDHPAGFPVSLPERCIRLHGKADAVVLDPFMGTGTTLLAAERLGCAGIGIDLDRNYVGCAAARLASVVGDS